MNIREAAENKKEIGELNLDNFYKWVCGQDVGVTTSEKIIDELQSCLDRFSTDESPIGKGIEILSYWYECRLHAEEKKVPQFVKEIPYENYPEELKIYATEYYFRSNFQSLNEALKKFGYKQLKNDYKIEDIEAIEEIIIDRINKLLVDYNGTCGEYDSKIEWNDPFLEELHFWLYRVIKHIDSSYYSILGTESWKKYFDIEDMITVYVVKYYFKNFSPIIKVSDLDIIASAIRKNTSFSHGRRNKNLLLVEGNEGQNFVCMREQEEQAREKLKQIHYPKREWGKHSKEELQEVVSGITEAMEVYGVSREPLNRSREDSYRDRIWPYFKTLTDLTTKEDIRIYRLPNVSNNMIVALKDNLYVKMLLAIKNKWEICNLEYGALCEADVIKIRNDKETRTIEIPLMKVDTTRASVVGRTMIGAAIGGSVGGVIGAASAVQKNINIARNEINSAPIQINAKVEEITVTCSNILTNPKGLFLTLYPSKSNRGKEQIEEFIKGINLARTKMSASITKMNLSEDALRDIVPINSYIKIKQEKIQIEAEKKYKEEVKLYWKEHKEEYDALMKRKKELSEKSEEKEKEKSENLKIMKDAQNQIEKQIEELRLRKGHPTEDEDEYDRQQNIIRDLEKERDACFIFQQKKKRTIMTRLNQIEWPKLKELKIKAEQQKERRNAETQNEIEMLKCSKSDKQKEGLKIMEKLNTEIKEIEMETLVVSYLLDNYNATSKQIAVDLNVDEKTVVPIMRLLEK